MNIEEARKVYWLKNNHRPLGELLDVGYLTRDRLEWAAQSAYNPDLKEGAKVILESLDSLPPVTEIREQQEIYGLNFKKEGIEVAVSLERARATLWPFRPFRDQQMGALVDARQLSLKDLGYAIENAWDERVKKAATVLSLIRLNQVVKEPAPEAGFVHIVSGGRSYSQRRESFYTLLQGALIGFWLALAIYFLISSFRRTGQPNSPARSFSEFISRPNGLLSLVVVTAILIFLGWLSNFVFERINQKIDRQIDAYRLGQEGEENVVQLVVQALDGNWHLFRNVVIPGRNKADLDLVLVGPPGIWVLEVKNFDGAYRNIGETWERKKGKTWESTKVNPSRQANNNALRLKNFLKADNINTFVNAAIVWANPEGTLCVENPTVTVWQSSRLADELGNIWQGEKVAEAERNKIVDKLTKLCQRQKSDQNRN